MTRESCKQVFLLVLALIVFAAPALADARGRMPPPPPPECGDDSQCGSGQVCEEGNCVLAPPVVINHECNADSDCASPKICKLVSGVRKCVIECEDDAGCGGSGRTCVNNRCQAAPVTTTCEIERVHFDFDQYYLTEEAKSTLQRDYTCLQGQTYGKIIVEGHCDERGSTEYNMALGQRRAKSIKDFLVRLGLAKKKLDMISYGEERPLSSGHDEGSWAQNRRGEFNVIQ